MLVPGSFKVTSEDGKAEPSKFGMYKEKHRTRLFSQNYKLGCNTSQGNLA